MAAGIACAVRATWVPAVMIADVNEAEVRNMRITGYNEGLLLWRTEGTHLHDLVIDSTAGHAIRLMGDTRHARIVDNDIGPAEFHGVALFLSYGNLIAGNHIIGTRDAVRLQNSRGNVVAYNRTVGSMIEGIDVHLSEANTFLFNDLMEVVAAPLLDDAERPGANTYDTRWGGNYVLRFDEAAEGCEDADEDGRCDAAYEFFADQGEDFFTGTITSETADFFDAEGAWAYAIERIAAIGSPEVVCSGCHDLELGVESPVGPPLHGIFGRDVATYPGFEYSPALEAMGGSWTQESVAAFLRDPEAFAPGTSMEFPGIDDDATIAGILRFLSSLEAPGPEAATSN